MDSTLESEQSVSCASAPLSTGAVAVGLAGTALAVFAAVFGYQDAAAMFVWAALAGLSGIAAALLERGTRRATIYFGAAVALLAGNLLAAWSFYGARPRYLVISAPYILIALLAPFLARRRFRNRISVRTYLLTLWLIPPLLISLLGAGIDIWEHWISGHRPFSPEHSVAFCLSLPFGPWATQFARVFSFPNAGEFFHLPTALAFTAVLGTIVFLIAARPRWAAYCLIPFAWLLIGWFTIGFVQLVNCLF